MRVGIAGIAVILRRVDSRRDGKEGRRVPRRDVVSVQGSVTIHLWYGHGGERRRHVVVVTVSEDSDVFKSGERAEVGLRRLVRDQLHDTRELHEIHGVTWRSSFKGAIPALHTGFRQRADGDPLLHQQGGAPVLEKLLAEKDGTGREREAQNGA
jgi:hypothetical protein